MPESVPAGLRVLIDRSLSKDPAHRPSDGAAFAEALRSGHHADVATIAASEPAELAQTAIYTRPGDIASATRGITPTEVAPASAQPSSSLLGTGWLAQRRRRRTAVGALAIGLIVLALVGLVLLDRRSPDPDASATGDTSTSLDATTTTTAPPPMTELLALDAADYRGLTETRAREALVAAGFVVTALPGASTNDLAGLVIDVQPNGPVARGSTVTVVIGDGTMPSPTEPGKGKGPGKDKGPGKNKP